MSTNLRDASTTAYGFMVASVRPHCFLVSVYPLAYMGRGAQLGVYVQPN